MWVGRKPPPIYERGAEMTRDELLERGEESVALRQIVERFDAVEEEYKGKPWTLEQIYANINILVSEKPCEDCIRRSDIGLTDFEIVMCNGDYKEGLKMLLDKIEKAPSVSPMPKIGRCKDCKYFEYDTVAKVNGIKLIVAHEICKRWGDGCKTKEDGYCFLFEPKMQEVEK